MATLRESDSYYLDVFTRESGPCQKIGTLFDALVEKLAARTAVNKRLQSFLETIAEKNSARFCAIPKQHAVDNGTMITWTVVPRHQHDVSMPAERSFVRLK